MRLLILSAVFLLAWTAVSAAEKIQVANAQLKWIDDVQVSSREAGIIDAIQVKPNDTVTAGAALVRLDRDVQQSEVEGAQRRFEIAQEESDNEVNLRYAEKTAEVAKKELQRIRAAIASVANAISQTELEQKELEVEQAHLSGQQAEHELAVNRLTTRLRQSELGLAQIKLAGRNIKSPLNGQVAEVLVQKGQWVDVGQPVARIVNLNTLRVVALVSEDYLYRVRNGQPAIFEAKIGKEPLSAKGKVSFVSPEVDPINRQFLVWVDIDNAGGKLRPGIVGSLSIEANGK